MRTVFVSGNFNILHPGHLRLLRFARECGERLVVAVQSDRIAGAAAHMPEGLRLEGVLANQWVDEAFICDEPVADAIARIQPDMVVKGREHEGRDNPEQAAVNRYGGTLIFSSGESVFSSLSLLQRDFFRTDLASIEVPVAYIKRHQLSPARLAALVDQFANVSLCVAGDLIVDEYITCDALGMSQEDPSVVVTPIDSKRFIGGAGIVAAHAAGLGARATLITVAGEDATCAFAEEKLAEYQVRVKLVVDTTRPTTLKQRYRAKGKTLLRVSHLRQFAIAEALQTEMRGHLADTLTTANALIFSDFNYGCLPQPLVDWASTAARAAHVLTAADSQSSSQIGNIARFRGMDLITPTEREARISTRNPEAGLVVLAEQLRTEAEARNVFLKMGAEGVLIHAARDDQSGWIDDRIEGLNSAPKDVAGAGDSMLTAATLALGAGGTIWEAAALGSIAAAIQVGRVGNTPLTALELRQELARIAAVV